MTEVKQRAKSNNLAQKELDNASEQFDNFDKQVKDLTMDRMNAAPKEDVEPQTKLSQKELDRSKDIYLKPKKSISVSSKEKFNETFRKEWEFSKEYVCFVAENNEIIGESIEIWTKPFAGVPAEYWEVPVNKPVYGPRHLAEQIKRCAYHRLSTREDKIVTADGMGQYYGQLIVDKTVQRLDARPANTKKSVFMTAGNF